MECPEDLGVAYGTDLQRTVYGLLKSTSSSSFGDVMETAVVLLALWRVECCQDRGGRTQRRDCEGEKEREGGEEAHFGCLSEDFGYVEKVEMDREYWNMQLLGQEESTILI